MLKSRILKHRWLSVCLQSGTSLLETVCKSCMPSGDAAFPAAWCVVASRQQEGSDREWRMPQPAVRSPWGQGSLCTLSLISSISSCFRCWCLNLTECYTNVYLRRRNIDIAIVSHPSTHCRIISGQRLLLLLLLFFFFMEERVTHQ